MAQRQYISPIRCLNNYSRSISGDATRPLQRFMQAGYYCQRRRIASLRGERQRCMRDVNDISRRYLHSSSSQRPQLHPIPIPSPSTQQHRPFTSTPPNPHGDLTPPKPGQERHITFIDKDSHSHTFTVADGDNLLDIAQANDVEMEGACGGSCACSTCHVIVRSDADYDKMEEPSDDENDMLDLAFGLTETSRLGCQVRMTRELDGLVVSI